MPAHQIKRPTDDLKEKLRIKLAKLVNPPPPIEDAVLVPNEDIDVDEEFGFDDD